MNSPQALRAGVVGLGRMGQRHVDAYLQLGAGGIFGADVRSEAGAELRAKASTAVAYTDWKQLFDEKELDIVSVVTNGPSHAEIVIAAAEKKVPYIFCEKPMATNLVDADRMIAACEKSGSKLFINMTKRIFPSTGRLLDFLHSGAIGDVRSVSVTIGGNRGIGCVGSHYVDLMRVILNSEPTRVWGRMDTTGTPNPRGAQFRDPGGYGIFEFKNGARGFLEMSEDIYLPPFVQITGSYGYVTVDESVGVWNAYHYDETVRLGGKVPPGTKLKVLTFDPGETIDLTVATARAIEDIIGGGLHMATDKDGRSALEMILGMHVSDKAGTPQKFPLVARTFDVPMT